nr:uncharacterized protein LOC109155321 [Ipomoea trifida]
MGESKYAYLQTNDGLYRVNIPDFDPAHQPEFMLECVSKNLSGTITPTMGIFSKGQDVYLFGGLMFGVKGTILYNRSLYFFNPRKVKEKEYPIRDSKLLYKSSLKYVPMVTPSVLQAKHKTYLFSVVRPDYGPMKALCYFQSFDPLKNCFCTLPTPSLDDSFLCYAPASQRCIPWDKVKPINNKSNEKEPKRKPGVVYLEKFPLSSPQLLHRFFFTEYCIKTALSPQALAAQYSGPEESMLFVFRNSKDQLEVHRKTLQMLNSINGPIIVVSVCGSAKQGKSYLLNKLFEGHAEFLVKYPCKNGLRLSKPIQKTTSNGTKYNILVIDTEAIDQIVRFS